MKELTNNDFVILENDLSPVRFSDGTIVIYNDIDEIIEDCKISGFALLAKTLSKPTREELIKQINS